MGAITAGLVTLSFLAGCVTLVMGYRVGHGAEPLITHLSWGLATLLLQFAAACVSVVHARAERRHVAALEQALAGSGAHGATSEPAGDVRV